jgi:predicted GNAT superfamily acetyltransferase
VVFNTSYQKIHRPDVVAQAIQSQSQSGNSLVAIAHRTHGQTGRMMGIAWDLQGTKTQPHYLLAHHSQQPRSVTIALRKALNQLPTPLDLWLINFQDVPTQPLDTVLKQNKCEAQMRTQSVDGYRYRLYRCQKNKV